MLTTLQLIRKSFSLVAISFLQQCVSGLTNVVPTDLLASAFLQDGTPLTLSFDTWCNDEQMGSMCSYLFLMQGDYVQFDLGSPQTMRTIYLSQVDTWMEPNDI